MPVTLVLHDAYDADGASATGFAGADADRYKLSCSELQRLFDAVETAGHPPVSDLHRKPLVTAGEIALTFDDGGVGAIQHTAELLERRDWRGYFLVVSDRIGTAGFLSRGQIRELHDRGHVIGTHTRTHPIPLSKLAPAAIAREWTESIHALEDVLGAPVLVGSVPGGFYSRRVGVEAEASGLRLLFTSEPRRSVFRIGACVVAGRFTVLRSTLPAHIAGLARGHLLPRFGSWAWWNAKKIPKQIGGGAWLALRRRLLKRDTRAR